MKGDNGGVGYKRPPKDSQFKPGRSGNPRGRPKGVASFKSDLAAEMRERIELRDKNGRPHKITKQRALIKMLFASALQSDKNAITALLACMKYFGTATEQMPPDQVDIEDLDTIKDFVARTEARGKYERDIAGQAKPASKKSRQ